MMYLYSKGGIGGLKMEKKEVYRNRILLYDNI